MKASKWVGAWLFLSVAGCSAGPTEMDDLATGGEEIDTDVDEGAPAAQSLTTVEGGVGPSGPLDPSPGGGGSGDLADLSHAPGAALLFPSAGPSESRGAAVALAAGGTAKLPCNTSSVRVQYRYRNSGASAAAAHTNRLTLGGAPAVLTQHGALLNPMTRAASATLNAAALGANQPSTLIIDLDSGNSVAEGSLESNNRFQGKLLRSCP